MQSQDKVSANTSHWASCHICTNTHVNMTKPTTTTCQYVDRRPLFELHLVFLGFRSVRTTTVQMWRICSRNESESVPLIFSRIYLARASDCNILNMWRPQITWLCFASDIETVLHALRDLQLSPQGQHLASKTRGLIRNLAPS